MAGIGAVNRGVCRRGVKKAVIQGMHALTYAEIQQYQAEEPRAGEDRSGGVGLVRVDGSRDVDWVVVRCFDLPVKYCPQHPQAEMALLKTTGTTDFNLKSALFYRCLSSDVNAAGIEVDCSSNLYIKYPRAQLNAEIAANGAIRLLKWGFKLQNP